MNHRKQVFISIAIPLAISLSTSASLAQNIQPSAISPAPVGAKHLRPNYPFPQHITYAPGTIRPNHRSQSIQDQDLALLYTQWKSRYLAPAGFEDDGHPRYRILHHRDPAGDTVSEGMGYGMIITAYMAGHDPDAKVIFGGLYEYVLDHPSIHGPHLMDWDIPADETSNIPDDDSAFDGDADIAYALLLASKQWGNAGRFNYANEASLVLDAIMLRTVGQDSTYPLLGDWVNEPGDEYTQYMARTSDFILGHFHAFARATNDDRWNDVALACQSIISHIQSTYSPKTGLIPDFIIPVSTLDHTPMPAQPFFIEGPNDGRFEYNACRDPWRLATDALINNDPVSRSQALAITQWCRSSTNENPYAIHAGYTLQGVPVPDSDYFSTAFTAPMAVAAMLDPTGQQWLNDLYDSTRTSNQDYYEDTLSVLSMLMLTGNWWDPTLVP